MDIKGGRKGQVTVFIVIGLVTLIVVFLIFYVTQESGTEDSGLEVLDERPEFSGQTELGQYVDACIRPAVLQGLEIIRLQGGYINIPPDVETMLVKDLDNNEQVKVIDGSKKVVIDEDGEGNEVPYWITKDSLAIPTLTFIEQELERYVTEEVMKCVNDFLPFREQKYDVEYSEISTDVEMENAVVADIKFPIKMKRGDLEFEEEYFAYIVPVDIRLMYDTAYDLTAFESVYGYLEDHTKSLISLYSSVDEERLPPFSMSITNIDCSSARWSKIEVGEKLKGIFGMNFPHLRIGGTNFELPQTEDSIAQGVYESFVLDFFEDDFPTLEVDFSYRPEWDFIGYDIKPSLGDSLLPHRVMQNRIPLFPPLCVFDYSFKYTIDHPVFVQIKDDESAKIDPERNAYFDEGDFRFQFLLDSYICGNQNRECTGRTEFEANEETIAEDLGITLLPDSYFCDEEQRISGEITINTFDKSTNNPLDNVDVFYWCGSYQNDCFIGRTDDDGVLKTKFPLCVNGIIYFSKADHTSKKEQLTVAANNPQILSYELSKPYKLNATVVKHKIRRYYWWNNVTMREELKIELMNSTQLGPNDNAILNVKRVGGGFDISAAQTLVFDTIAQKNEITLSPGEHKINGMLITDGFTIAANCYRYCNNYDDDGDCDSHDTKPNEPITDTQETAILGGVEIKSSNTYWNVTENDLEQAEEIEFHIIQVPTPTCISEARGRDESCMIGNCVGMDEMGKTEDYTTMFRSYLTPKFS